MPSFSPVLSANTQVVNYFSSSFFSPCCLCQVSVIFVSLRSKFPPSVFALSVPPALIEDLRVAVLVPVDAMLIQLLSFHPFAESVLDPDHRKLSYHNTITTTFDFHLCRHTHFLVVGCSCYIFNLFVCIQNLLRINF